MAHALEIDWLLRIDPWIAAACVIAMIAGGAVKGVTGVGLPMVALPVLATVMTVPQAIALMTLPSITTSMVQAVQGGNFRPALARLWWLLGGTALGLAASVKGLVTMSTERLYLILGVIVMLFSVVLIRSIRLRFDLRHEWWIGSLTGVLAGLVCGISMFVGPIYVMYIAALGLTKDVFVAAISIANLSAAVLLTLFLTGYGMISAEQFAASALCVLIVFVGLMLGQRLRARIDEAGFRKALAIVLFLIGANLVRRAFA